MLKHHCSTLFVLPTAKTLQSDISSPFFIDETTPSSNCFAFSFPLLKHHCFIIFPDAETPLFNTFCSPYAKTLQSAIPHFLHRRNNTVQQLFRPIFLVAETPLFSSSSHRNNTVQQLFRSSLLLKHQFFNIICQQAFTPSYYSSSFQSANPRHNSSIRSKVSATTTAGLPWTGMIFCLQNESKGKARYVNFM
jgi:hypothetical protein